jgi:hypothetical protein
MRYACIVELHVTVNNAEMLNAAQNMVCWRIYLRVSARYFFLQVNPNLEFSLDILSYNFPVLNFLIIRPFGALLDAVDGR